MLLESPTLQRLARRMDGRLGEHLVGTGIETLDGAAPLEEVLAVIGVENRMRLHRHLEVGDEVGVLGGEEIGTVTATTITGGCRRLEGTVIPPLPDVDAEAVGIVGIVEIVGEAEEGQKTQDLAAHPVGTPDTIERTVGPDKRG